MRTLIIDHDRDNLAMYLVSSTYQVEVVFVEELGHHLGPEGEADPPVVLAPAHRVLVGV